MRATPVNGGTAAGPTMAVYRADPDDEEVLASGTIPGLHVQRFGDQSVGRRDQRPQVHTDRPAERDVQGECRDLPAGQQCRIVVGDREVAVEVADDLRDAQPCPRSTWWPRQLLGRSRLSSTASWPARTADHVIACVVAAGLEILSYNDRVLGNPPRASDLVALCTELAAKSGSWLDSPSCRLNPTQSAGGVPRRRHHVARRSPTPGHAPGTSPRSTPESAPPGRRS